MVILFFQQFLRFLYGLVVVETIYLRQVSTVRKLHLNDWQLNSFLPLLKFWPINIAELHVLQMEYLGMDLVQVIQGM